MEIIFESPKYLLYSLFILIVIITHFLVLRVSRKKAILFANFEALSRVSRKYLFTQNNYQLIIRVVAITCIVFALSGTVFIYSSPQATAHTMILIDASDSTIESYGQETLLDREKEIAERYVQQQHPLSLMGIISFSSVTKIEQAPERGAGKAQMSIRRIRPHQIGGTDVGTALINGIQMLDSVRGGRKILVLSDGRASFGTALRDAMDEAVNRNIEISSVVAGNPDEERIGYSVSALRLMANMTGGQVVFAGRSPDAIAQQLTTHRPADIHIELREYLLVAALIIITLEWALSKSIYKTIPHD